MVKRIALLATVVCAGAVAFAACGFPDVDFADTDTESGSPVPSPDGTAGDGQSPGDGGVGDELPPDVDPTGKDKDAATKGDADTKVDASGCTTCDCDHDTFFFRDGGCTGGPGSVYDCDDTDSFINPNQQFVSDFTWPSKVHPVAYDWNCDGKVDKQYLYGVKCGLLTDCSAQGFATNPACGVEADYIFCKDSLVLGLTCTEDIPRRQKRKQGCR